MTSRNTLIAMFLSLLAPLAAVAQTTDKPAEKAEAVAPAQAAAPAPAKPAVSFDFGGWLLFNTWWNQGSFNAADFPRNAAGDEDEKAAGFSVRQSRLRLGANVPSGGGILGNPALRGFVELDFSGGYAGGSNPDESMPLFRLRHAYVTANWKEHGNLTLLVGQTNDIFHGWVGAASLSHLATPRFSGAGFLHRRAPQIRLSGEVGKDLAVGWTVGAVSPYDKTTIAPNPGYRSVLPHAEARLAFMLRGASKLKVEVGVGAKYGQEKFRMVDGSDETVKSQGAAADLKVEFGRVALVGGAFLGENLDGENSIAPGVVTTSTAAGVTPAGLLTVKSVPTKGGWGQLQLTPVKGFLLLAGAGMDMPDEDLIGATAIKKNLQISGGAIVNLTSKWRAGLEYTRYQTELKDDTKTEASQVEFSTLLAF